MLPEFFHWIHRNTYVPLAPPTAIFRELFVHGKPPWSLLWRRKLVHKFYIEEKTFDPVRSNIQIQILHTGLHTFSFRIHWKNLTKDQSISPLVIISNILITFSLIMYWYCQEAMDVGHSGDVEVAPCTVLNSGFHAVDSRFQELDSSLCQWNLDSGFQSLMCPGLLELYSGFQSPGFRIPIAKFPWIMDSTCQNFAHSGIRIPLGLFQTSCYCRANWLDWSSTAARLGFRRRIQSNRTAVAENKPQS